MEYHRLAYDFFLLGICSELLYKAVFPALQCGFHAVCVICTHSNYLRQLNAYRLLIYAVICDTVFAEIHYRIKQRAVRCFYHFGKIAAVKRCEYKTLGMIGCGRISQLTMQKCKYGFGMNVIGYDPYLTQDKIGDLCELKATAKEVWEQADFVSVHLPVVPSTEHSIGREQFSWMKPTASFINCARGALIKENELVECLKDGTLFQAGLDVFEHEPIQESSRELFNLDNVIMTPHMAATTEQSVLNCCTSVANDIVAVCNGQEPKVKAQKPKF